MENVFISEINENALKMTPTDVMANRLLKCRCMHRTHTHTQQFEVTSLGAAGLVTVEDDLSPSLLPPPCYAHAPGPSHVASSSGARRTVLTAKQNIRWHWLCQRTSLGSALTSVSSDSVCAGCGLGESCDRSSLSLFVRVLAERCLPARREDTAVHKCCTWRCCLKGERERQTKRKSGGGKHKKKQKKNPQNCCLVVSPTAEWRGFALSLMRNA